MPTQVYYSEIVNLIVIFVNKYNRLKATVDRATGRPIPSLATRISINSYTDLWCENEIAQRCLALLAAGMRGEKEYSCTAVYNCSQIGPIYTV
eukprot:COSAG01_NODE_2210_length_8163_cov_4.921999_13_plen_93_part_00